MHVAQQRNRPQSLEQHLFLCPLVFLADSHGQIIYFPHTILFFDVLSEVEGQKPIGFENFSEPFKGGRMSDKIKEKCREYPGRLLSLNLAFESRYEKLTECGIDVEGITDNDQTHEILEAAKRTGSDVILSQADALEKAVENEVFAERYASQTSGCSNTDDYTRALDCKKEESRLKQNASNEVETKGINNILATLPKDKRAAIQKEADRFIKDAKALIAKMRTGK